MTNLFQEHYKNEKHNLSAFFRASLIEAWGQGIILSLILFLLGYIIWDRRTALNPIQAKTIILEERVRKLEYVSKEQAKKDPAFAEILRAAGLL